LHDVHYKKSRFKKKIVAYLIGNESENNCKQCKKNKTQQVDLGCPYENLQDKRFYDFLYYNEPDFGVWGCPTYYKQEYGSIFSKVYNAIEHGLLEKHKLSYFHRTILLVIKDFLDTKENFLRKKQKKEAI
jgi:hypothetical protein